MAFSVLSLILLLLASLTVAQEERVCFYTEKNYGGTELCAKEGESMNVYDVPGNLNDDFESVKVPTGLQVVVYYHGDFQGNRKKYQRDTTDLGEFSNHISSFIVQPFRSRVCFYTVIQFGGTEYCSSVGDMIDLKAQCMHDNTFESVKVGPGSLVKAFADEGFQGRFTWFTKDTDNLEDFNNIISSYIVEHESEVCFYTHGDYDGEVWCVKPGDAHDIASLSHLNDQFSSVQVPRGLFVKAYLHDGFDGYSQTFTENILFLEEFNDRISSFVVGLSGVVCFYTEVGWKGSKFCATDGAKIDVSFFESFNDRFQSLIIPDDLQVKAFTDADYTGTMVKYQTTTWSLGTFSNEISSFIVTSATPLYNDFGDGDIMALERNNGWGHNELQP